MKKLLPIVALIMLACNGNTGPIPSKFKARLSENDPSMIWDCRKLPEDRMCRCVFLNPDGSKYTGSGPCEAIRDRIIW